LILACSNGNLKVVKLLIEAGADVDQDRWNTGEVKNNTLYGFIRSFGIFTQSGADINATDRMSNTLINMVMSRDDNTWANFLIDGEQILQS